MNYLLILILLLLFFGLAFRVKRYWDKKLEEKDIKPLLNEKGEIPYWDFVELYETNYAVSDEELKIIKKYGWASYERKRRREIIRGILEGRKSNTKEFKN